MQETIGFLIYDSSRLFRRVLNERTRDKGVTGLQWRMLASLARNEGINQGGLAQLLEVEPITLSRMVDRLTEAGLIERRADPNDRRAWKLYLTAEAQPLVGTMRAQAMELNEHALEGFSADERESLRHLLERMRENLTRGEQSA